MFSLGYIPGFQNIEGLKYILTATRRRWMNNYMKDYRQGKLRGDIAGQHSQPTRCAELKAAHRIHSFKSRLSKLLSPQYEILACVQYEPEYGVFQTDDSIIIRYSDEFCTNVYDVLSCFPILGWEFEFSCRMGGNEIFKPFFSENIVKSRIGLPTV